MMKKYWLVLILVLWAVKAEAKLMDLGYFELDNGLKVAVVENHKAPVALAMVYYKTGSVNDPSGQGGIAHLLEHMMFRGTKKLPEQQFNQIADEHGAENNAYTTYDQTAYYEFTDVSKLELMLAMEAERMQNLTINDAHFYKEREVVLQERMQRFETKPTSLFYELMSKMLWQNHPMAKPVSGSIEDIKSLTPDDARSFYKKYYCPNNAVLVLAGDVTLEEAELVVRKYFDKIPSGIAKYDTKPIVGREIDTDTVVRLDGVNQARYVQNIRLNGGSLTKQNVAALDLLTDYFSSDDTDFLVDELVYKDKKLLSISTSIGYDEKLGGTLSIYAVPTDDKMTLHEIKKLIVDKIKEGIVLLTPEKLEKIKHKKLATTVYLQENPQSAAYFVGGMIMNGYSPEEIRTYDEKLKNITIGDIQSAWQKVVTSKSQVTGYLKGRK